MEFWRLWQGGKFYSCHEALEGLWRDTSGESKLFYQGLIHCAVAMYQHSRGKPAAAAAQLIRAQAKLLPFAPVYYEVPVETFLTHVELALQPSLQRLDRDQTARLQALRRSVEIRVQQQLQTLQTRED